MRCAFSACSHQSVPTALLHLLLHRPCRWVAVVVAVHATRIDELNGVRFDATITDVAGQTSAIDTATHSTDATIGAMMPIEGASRFHRGSSIT